MIMSLGGSPEPLIQSIGVHKPERIIFLASHNSVALAGDILKKTEFKPEVSYEITENPNLMFECYKAARLCVDRVRMLGTSPDRIMVDYTGGTKVMTAALILATIGQPFRFNYVGGDQRTKGGLGVVKDGHEKMHAEMSPWSIFAEEERRQVVTLFNRRRFSAVVQIIDDCSTRELPLEIHNYFSFVRPLAEGFLFWDQFNHDVARRKIDSGYASLRSYLKHRQHVALETFALQVEQCRRFLDQIQRETDGMKKLHPILIDDLLNNARRRMADKRHDDAAARIYRALELYGQITFFEVAGCTNDKVREDLLPSALKAEFIRKYRDPAHDVLKLPLEATFKYLREKGHGAGIRYFERHKEIKKIQNSRNSSILAHGIQPVKESGIQSIYKTVTDFVQFKNIFDFPLLP